MRNHEAQKATLIGILIAVVLGYIKNPIIGLIGATHYGFPAVWRTMPVVAPQYQVVHYNLVGLIINIIFWSGIALLVMHCQKPKKRVIVRRIIKKEEKKVDKKPLKKKTTKKKELTKKKTPSTKKKPTKKSVTKKKTIPKKKTPTKKTPVKKKPIKEKK